MRPAEGDQLNGETTPGSEPKTRRSIPRYSSMPNSGDHAEGSRRKPKSRAAVPESLQVIAGGEDGNGDHYRVIRFTKQDGRLVELVLPDSELMGEENVLLGTLRGKGLFISRDRDAKVAILDYINDTPPPKR